MKKNLGLLQPDCTVAKIKDVVVSIMSPYGLDCASKVMLYVTNLENQAKIALDSDFGLDVLLKIHQVLGVKTLTVEVAPALYPQFQDSSLLQALLTNLGVVLPGELINQLNDSIGENTSIGGQAIVRKDDVVEGQATVGGGESDEDALLSNYSDRNDCINNDVNAQVMQAKVDGAVVGTLVDEDSEGTTETDVDSDSDGSLSGDNEEVKGVVDSSDDDIELGTIKLTNYIQQHEYKVGADRKNRLKLGHVFIDVAHFREILHEVMIRKGFAIKTVYSEPRRFVGTCKEAGCPCKTVKVSSSWVASKIKSQVAIDPNVKIDLLKNFMQETYGLKIENLTLYRARAKARTEVFGDHSKGYQKLFEYAAAIHKADPGAICKVLCDGVSIPDKVLFQRFFVSFPAQRNAFLNGCRPFIGIDGCHLKGKYGGVLLATVGMDGNNGIVPLAVCVCEIENTKTWGWFMEYLHSYLEDGRQLKQLFWKVTKSCNRHDFEEVMAEIKAVKEAAFECLERELTGYSWSMHTYDRNCMVDQTDNNASECFNNWILPYRDRPCLTMLEEIICRLMKRFTKRRHEAATWKGQLALKVVRELDKKRKLAQKMIVQASGELNFQVMDAAYSPRRRFVVKLESRTCDCGYWEIAGLPCQHAMAAIGYARHAIEEYVPAWFATQSYLNTYSVMFSPLPNQCTWERTRRPLIDPPIVQKKASQTATTAKSIDSKVATSQSTRKIPSGPGQSSNTRGRKRRAQVGSGDTGTRGEQSSQGLSQSENPSQASNVIGYMRVSAVNHCQNLHLLNLHDQNIALRFCGVVETIAHACTPHQK
ncbi:SWIM-type domain-containing protein [Citrus sinensis]|uniref:SWIM-type domain-containing protein n=1 Tax=Citrus sinensis TaxID=2711 RepID=A0ACB8L504_CITSI|nr:SWIM-type domain-containing protein [Citrus sinensis]